MPTTAVFTVEGMSCGHCERTVTAGLTALDGVTDVTADAKSGQVTIESTEPLPEDQVRSAVIRAGFALIGRA
ncbi:MULTISPECIES: heavy-metal-associated domain-containing protein [Kitasatospora]|uniref:Putative metal-binding protein n=1 Tax=Kitasatospora setae (strain ATCC 33774 / DSM 43861 / JCM 3304 / KCC A-0304 / NBRC 14216 / KM-6054) TaxID=452652 RepID=E4NJ80_KITSK|nr:MULTISPECIES: heavy-metal-associated domain-containing protein [Kitasatospora]BAJ33028.1 putative metal-binding protein [Kitasatospora setae KM-6054]